MKERERERERERELERESREGENCFLCLNVRDIKRRGDYEEVSCYVSETICLISCASECVYYRKRGSVQKWREVVQYFS